MPAPIAPLPDWEQVLSAAAHLQAILPGAVLVGDTASALHAGHRFSRDADHVLTESKQRCATCCERWLGTPCLSHSNGAHDDPNHSN